MAFFDHWEDFVKGRWEMKGSEDEIRELKIVPEECPLSNPLCIHCNNVSAKYLDKNGWPKGKLKHFVKCEHYGGGTTYANKDGSSYVVCFEKKRREEGKNG